MTSIPPQKPIRRYGSSTGDPKTPSPNRARAEAMAFGCTYPEGKAARVICATEAKGPCGTPDITELIRNLESHAERVNVGDMSRIEGMLVSQAIALESLFTHLAERAMGHTQIPGFEANMRMALRAQSQSRATIEALINLKNPPVVYARQANIANGPQQVNNHGSPPTGAPAREESPDSPNKLLEISSHELLDTGEKSEASRGHPPLETVGEVHRPPHRGRKGRSGP